MGLSTNRKNPGILRLVEQAIPKLAAEGMEIGLANLSAAEVARTVSLKAVLLAHSGPALVARMWLNRYLHIELA
jgi:hypothetical protein